MMTSKFTLASLILMTALPTVMCNSVCCDRRHHETTVDIYNGLSYQRDLIVCLSRAVSSVRLHCEERGGFETVLRLWIWKKANLSLKNGNVSVIGNLGFKYRTTDGGRTLELFGLEAWSGEDVRYYCFSERANREPSSPKRILRLLTTGTPSTNGADMLPDCERKRLTRLHPLQHNAFVQHSFTESFTFEGLARLQLNVEGKSAIDLWKFDRNDFLEMREWLRREGLHFDIPRWRNCSSNSTHEPRACLEVDVQVNESAPLDHLLSLIHLSFVCKSGCGGETEVRRVLSIMRTATPNITASRLEMRQAGSNVIFTAPRLRNEEQFSRQGLSVRETWKLPGVEQILTVDGHTVKLSTAKFQTRSPQNITVNITIATADGAITETLTLSARVPYNARRDSYIYIPISLCLGIIVICVSLVCCWKKLSTDSSVISSTDSIKLAHV